MISRVYATILYTLQILLGHVSAMVKHLPFCHSDTLVNDRNTRKSCENCLKLTRKTPVFWLFYC